MAPNPETDKLINYPENPSLKNLTSDKWGPPPQSHNEGKNHAKSNPKIMPKSSKFQLYNLWEIPTSSPSITCSMRGSNLPLKTSNRSSLKFPKEMEWKFHFWWLNAPSKTPRFRPVRSESGIPGWFQPSLGREEDPTRENAWSSKIIAQFLRVQRSNFKLILQVTYAGLKWLELCMRWLISLKTMTALFHSKTYHWPLLFEVWPSNA